MVRQNRSALLRTYFCPNCGEVEIEYGNALIQLAGSELTSSLDEEIGDYHDEDDGDEDEDEDEDE